jgi:hypothetical protein
VGGLRQSRLSRKGRTLASNAAGVITNGHLSLNGLRRSQFQNVKKNGESLLAFTKNECKNQQLMVALKKTAN